MKIAVLTLTRDRLDYTKTCFKALRQNAGCDFDHYVLDQGSTDGTWDWLVETQRRPKLCGNDTWVFRVDENIGIHRGMNLLLDNAEGYDLLVKVDNDCRVLTPGTLRAVADYVLAETKVPCVVSPLILGLRNRPGIYATETSWGLEQETRLGLTRALGGIFMPLPPFFVKAGFRYDETAPLFGGDDERISSMAHEQGGYTAYLLDFEAEHIETTLGQVQRYPEYFARRVQEGGPPQ